MVKSLNLKPGIGKLVLVKIKKPTFKTTIVDAFITG
jgi:hypothetical protein